jgi:hypothetical protein
MRQNILLTVAAPSAEQMTFEMSPHIAQHLASEIPVVLAEMEQGNTTKQ